MKILYAAVPIFLMASGSTLAQNATGFCQSYAANAAGMSERAIKRNPACLDYSKGVHGEFKMHYDWCMKTPASSVQGAEANIRRLVSACTGNSPAGGAPAARSAATTKWSGAWDWVRPLAVFGNAQKPYRTHATFELLPNSRVRVCVSTNPCNVYPFTSGNGGYNIESSGGFIFARTHDQGRTLNGQFWWDKNKRNQISADAFFVLKQ